MAEIFSTFSVRLKTPTLLLNVFTVPRLIRLKHKNMCWNVHGWKVCGLHVVHLTGLSKTLSEFQHPVVQVYM